MGGSGSKLSCSATWSMANRLIKKLDLKEVKKELPEKMSHPGVLWETLIQTKKKRSKRKVKRILDNLILLAV